jgi:phosphatidylserine/phosphatidylglycerophosphate/cardiolipin synthase-like enzyme
VRRALCLSFAVVAAACGSSAPSAAPAGDDAGVGTSDDASAEAPPAEAAPPPACAETDARTPPAKLLVMPDAGEAPFVASLQKATQSIRVLAYDLGSGGVLSTLEAKAKAGVDVHVILDTGEQSFDQPAYDALQAAGAKVEWSDPKFTYMHAKTFVVDGTEAVVSSGNFVLSQMQVERNFAAVIDDPQDVALLSALLGADWARQSPDLSCTRLLVAPVNAKDRILSLIKSATKSVDVESMEFSDSDVQAAVLAAYKAGIAVRVLIADTGFVSSNSGAEQFMRNFSIPGKTLASPVLHVKAIVVDGARAYLGSENLSWTSLTQNREVGLELVAANGEDVASMEATFEADWAKGALVTP